MAESEHPIHVVMLAGKCGHHHKDDCTSCANANTVTNFEIRRLHTEINRLREALEDARQIITEIDDYMKRPERGDYGVECALCMGELLDDDRDTIAHIDATLKDSQ